VNCCPADSYRVCCAAVELARQTFTGWSVLFTVDGRAARARVFSIQFLPSDAASVAALGSASWDLDGMNQGFGAGGRMFVAASGDPSWAPPWDVLEPWQHRRSDCTGLHA